LVNKKARLVRAFFRSFAEAMCEMGPLLAECEVIQFDLVSMVLVRLKHCLLAGLTGALDFIAVPAHKFQQGALEAMEREID
jgi:hypothetical protein